jgi:BNR/Asp-box repeat
VVWQKSKLSKPSCLALLAATVFLCLGVGIQVASASSPTWPSSHKAHPWTGQAGTKGPMTMGTLVSKALLQSEGGVESPSYKESTGWATATLHHYLYPIVSHDRGRTWHVGGVYFAVPIAKSFYYVSAVKIFTTSVVAIYARGSETFDMTSDGGHHWIQTFFPGLIRSVTNSGSLSGYPEGVIKIEVQTNPNLILSTGYYTSRDGGLTWKLSATK